MTTVQGLACAGCAPGLDQMAGSNFLSGSAAGSGGVVLHDGDPGTAELKTLSLVLVGLRLFLGR